MPFPFTPALLAEILALIIVGVFVIWLLAGVVGCVVWPIRQLYKQLRRKETDAEEE